MTTAIELSHLRRGYPGADTYLFDDLSMSIDQGDFCIVTGSSGSGKTSLLKLITGQLNHEKKQVKVLGTDLSTKRFYAKQKVKRSIGIIFQDYQLIPWKNVIDNVSYSLEISGLARNTMVELSMIALKNVGLEGYEMRNIETLSGGQQQRVAIARAIVHEPTLIIADEITGNLDPNTSKQIADIMIHLYMEGKTILFITHDMQLIEYFTSQIHPKFFYL